MSYKYNKIKGVIVAAGYGTRFLPASKTVPKELFPLIDMPCIEFTVQEFLSAGIEDILVITSRRKKVLEDYLDHEMELEMILNKVGSQRRLEKITPSEANFHFVRQREMRGTADALRLCRPFCGDSPFVVAYPDDVFFGEVGLTQQLIDVYKQTNKSVISVQDFVGQDVSRYGVISYDKKESDKLKDNVYSVNSIVEKPAKGTEPSTMVSLGRYLYTPDLFNAIEELPGLDKWEGEISQTVPLNILAKEHKLLALDFEGTRFDVGEPFGYLTTIVEYEMTRPKIAPFFKEYLKDNIERLLAK